jgi:hypothetical protein
MRQFEEFGRAMAVILRLKKQNDWEKLEAEIEAATTKFTSLEIAYVEELTPEAFESEIILSKELSPDQRKMLADLLFEKMWYHRQVADAKRFRNLHHQCTELYKQVKEDHTQQQYDLDLHYKITMLGRTDFFDEGD